MMRRMLSSSSCRTTMQLVLLVVVVLVSFSEAFVVRQPASSSVWTVHKNNNIPTPVLLHMADEEKNEGESVDTEDEIMAEDDEEEEEVEEDPEITALKSEIAEWESALKEKRRQVASYADRADDFTKAGYARKVAEMEMMRRARSMLNSSNKYSATASILAEFLPVLDRLNELRDEYGEDEFGKQYNALPGAMMTAFSQLGVTEYTSNTGDEVDKERMIVIDEEYSENYPKDTVIRPVAMGMELQGNVIRMAEVVASLGPEAVEEEEQEEMTEEEQDADEETVEDSDKSE